MRHPKCIQSGIGAVGCLLFGAWVAPVQAQEPPGEESNAPRYIWAFQYNPGETHRQRLKFEINGEAADNGSELKMSGTLLTEHTTKSATSSGTGTVVVKTISRSAVLNGRKLPNPTGPRPIITMTLGSNGRLLKQTVTNGEKSEETLQELIAMTRHLPVPLQAVRVGETWKTEVDNRLLKGKKVTITSTLVGQEKVGDVTALKIKTQAVIPTHPDALTRKGRVQEGTIMEGLSYLDPRRGHVLRTHFALDNVEMESEGGSLYVRIVLQEERLRPGDTGEVVEKGTEKKTSPKPGEVTTPIQKPGEDDDPPPPPPPAPDDRTFTLTPHYAKGQVWRYQTQSSMTLAFRAADGTNSSLTLSAAQETNHRYQVRETKSDGTAVMGVLLDGGKTLDVSDEAKPLPKDPDNAPRTVTLDKQGRITEFKDKVKSDKDANPLGDLTNQTNLFVPLHLIPLPDHPVKVGDTWKVRCPLPNAKLPPLSAETTAEDEEKDTALQATMTLQGTEKQEGVELLKIKQVVTFPYEGLTDALGKSVTDPKRAAGKVRVRLTFTQTALVQPTDGLLVRSEGEISGEVRFEGAVARQLPGDVMTIRGKVAATKLKEK